MRIVIGKTKVEFWMYLHPYGHRTQAKYAGCQGINHTFKSLAPIRGRYLEQLSEVVMAARMLIRRFSASSCRILKKLYKSQILYVFSLLLTKEIYGNIHCWRQPLLPLQPTISAICCFSETDRKYNPHYIISKGST